jgi:hypothetical protein
MRFCTKNFVQAAYNNSCTTSVYNKASACEHEYVEVRYLQTQNIFTHQITKVILSF